MREVTREQFDAVLREFGVQRRTPSNVQMADTIICLRDRLNQTTSALLIAREDRDSARRLLDATAQALGFAKTYDASMLPARADALAARVAAVQPLVEAATRMVAAQDMLDALDCCDGNMLAYSREEDRIGEEYQRAEHDIHAALRALAAAPTPTTDTRPATGEGA